MVLNLILFIYVNILLFFIRCQEGDDVDGEIVFIDTTTEYIARKTDIPEEYVQMALNFDVGRYTTQAFRYHNSQFDSPVGLEVIPCFDSHIKCLLTIVVPHQVCTVNYSYDYYEGYRNFDTYCDAYLDNCLRRMRFWRIIDFGVCQHHWGKKDFEILQTRRKNYQKYRHVFKLLTGTYTYN